MPWLQGAVLKAGPNILPRSDGQICALLSSSRPCNYPSVSSQDMVMTCYDGYPVYPLTISYDAAGGTMKHIKVHQVHPHSGSIWFPEKASMTAPRAKECQWRDISHPSLCQLKAQQWQLRSSLSRHIRHSSLIDS